MATGIERGDREGCPAGLGLPAAQMRPVESVVRLRGPKGPSAPADEASASNTNWPFASSSTRDQVNPTAPPPKSTDGATGGGRVGAASDEGTVMATAKTVLSRESIATSIMVT